MPRMHAGKIQNLLGCFKDKDFEMSRKEDKTQPCPLEPDKETLVLLLTCSLL